MFRTRFRTTFQIPRWRAAIAHGIRLAALVAAVSLAFGSLAWAHDDDDYYSRHDAARENGYQAGYRDGMSHGRYDRERGARYNFKSDRWEDADAGFQHWMGSRGRYKKAYRNGYVNGYNQGFSFYGNYWNGDRDNYRRRDYRDDYGWHDRDDWR
jgi:hypothetical protein